MMCESPTCFSVSLPHSCFFLSLGLWAVVNNAGILHFPIDGELLPMASYRRCMAVNFFGTVEVTKAFLPLLRKSKGRLVNISSMGGESACVMWSWGACHKTCILCGLHKRAGRAKAGLGHSESVCVFTVDLSLLSNSLMRKHSSVLC